MSLEKALGGMKRASEPPSQVDSKPASQLGGKAARRLGDKASTENGNGGKRSDPEFKQVNVYIRKKTWKAASRKWEDEDDGDFSNLVESLLAEYLAS